MNYPRIDLLAGPIGSDSEDADLIRGVPTAGATLTNLAGAPAVPAGMQPRAYILVAPEALSVADRR